MKGLKVFTVISSLVGVFFFSFYTFSQERDGGNWKFLVQNSKPIFQIYFSDDEEVSPQYYEVSLSSFSRNYFSLTLEQLGVKKYTRMIHSSDSNLTCFLTKEDWNNADISSLDVSLSQLDNRLSLIFRRHISSGSDPIPFPVPLPFKLNKELRPQFGFKRDIMLGNEYQMDSTQQDSRGNTIYSERTSIKFMNQKENPNSVEIYQAGFRKFDLCFTP